MPIQALLYTFRSLTFTEFFSDSLVLFLALSTTKQVKQSVLQIVPDRFFSNIAKSNLVDKLFFLCSVKRHCYCSLFISRKYNFPRFLSCPFLFVRLDYSLLITQKSKNKSLIPFSSELQHVKVSSYPGLVSYLQYL